jgi:Asp-tRNA(Asn)/Glu-tRNA(Gln) amidotransferase C subunit
VEIRHEQDEMIENLQKQLSNIEQIIDQTNDIDDVETLDRTYEVLIFQ